MNRLIMPLLAGAGLLSGCAGMNSDFDCNTVAHDRCMTMEQANQQAAGNASSSATSDTNGEAGKGEAAAEPLPRLAPVPVSPSPLTGIQSASRDAGVRSARSSQAPSGTPRLLPRRSSTSSSSRLTSYPAYTATAQVYADTGVTPPVRVNPTTARLWIAAWIDSDDVYHQPSVVSFVAVADHWAGR